jgi:hypothetical protein
MCSPCVHPAGCRQLTISLNNLQKSHSDAFLGRSTDVKITEPEQNIKGSSVAVLFCKIYRGGSGNYTSILHGTEQNSPAMRGGTSNGRRYSDDNATALTARLALFASTLRHPGRVLMLHVNG